MFYTEQRLKIAEATIEWADAYDEATKRDERPPVLQSNFEFRVEAARKLQEIRKLVRILHEKERQGGSDAGPRHSEE